MMNKEQKQNYIAEMTSQFENSKSIVVTHYQGLTMPQLDELRLKMREHGIIFKITKNRITKLALEKTKCKDLSNLFSGPTAIAVSEDPVSAPKTVSQFAKNNDKLSIIGGGLDGKILSIAEVEQLASLPSLDELRGKLVGLIKSPSQKLASVSVAPANKLVNVFHAKANQ